jgi:putative ABC transport system permease protein
MTLRRGRTLAASDMAAGAPPAVVINERLAALAWPGEDPIGKRLSTWAAGPAPEWREVVGVVADVRSLGLDTPPRPELFLPYTQPPVMAWNSFERSMALVVRTDGNPSAAAPSVRRSVQSLDPTLPLYDVQTMDEALGADVAGSRFTTWLLSLLAIIGLVLAAVGLYGVIPYFVTQRTAEFGLRLALGASPRAVLLMVVRQGALLGTTGIVIGLVAALAAARVIASMLFEITETDPITYVSGALVLFAIALLACIVPAARALRVSPTRALAGS